MARRSPSDDGAVGDGASTTCGAAQRRGDTVPVEHKMGSQLVVLQSVDYLRSSVQKTVSPEPVLERRTIGAEPQHAGPGTGK